MGQILKDECDCCPVCVDDPPLETFLERGENASDLVTPTGNTSKLILIYSVFYLLCLYVPHPNELFTIIILYVSLVPLNCMKIFWFKSY